MTNGMRIATGQFNEPTTDALTFAAQMGVSGVVLNNPKLPGDQRWEKDDLAELRKRVETFGLQIESIENVPMHFYDQAMLGTEHADQQIKNYQDIIRNMGDAGIPVLGYGWTPNGVWRTSWATPIRDGALVSAFDLNEADTTNDTQRRLATLIPGTFDENHLWSTYEKFTHAVLPVAEASGVRLALHPADPPISPLGGIGRIASSFDGFKKAMAIADSPNNGLNFCMGCWSEMGEDVISVMKHFLSKNQIFYVHFRDVQGTVPSFNECFLGEGNVDIAKAMRTLYRGGFTGFLIDDHVPTMLGDSEWVSRGRALETGKMIGLLAAIKLEQETT